MVLVGQFVDCRLYLPMQFLGQYATFRTGLRKVGLQGLRMGFGKLFLVNAAYERTVSTVFLVDTVLCDTEQPTLKLGILLE